MNVIFEGINGSGKTTIINELVSLMRNDNITVNSISEINDISPVAIALEEMYRRDTFLRMHEKFSTILVESLILAADYMYMQEYAQGLKGINIFDRDIFTQIVYQKYFIEKEYGENNEFFEAWKKCIMYNMKKIDVIVWVDAPLEICINRTVKRDNVEFDDEKTKVLIDLLDELKEFVFDFSAKNNIKLIKIDGTIDVKDNAKFIYENIKEL